MGTVALPVEKRNMVLGRIASLSVVEELVSTPDDFNVVTRSDGDIPTSREAFFALKGNEFGLELEVDYEFEYNGKKYSVMYSEPEERDEEAYTFGFIRSEYFLSLTSKDILDRILEGRISKVDIRVRPRIPFSSIEDLFVTVTNMEEFISYLAKLDCRDLFRVFIDGDVLTLVTR